MFAELVDTVERLADARSALVVALFIAVVVLARACQRLYRDKNDATHRMEELSERILRLVEELYERRIHDLRISGAAPPPTPLDEARGRARGSQAPRPDQDAGRPDRGGEA